MWKPFENIKGKTTSRKPNQENYYNVEELTTRKVNLQTLVTYLEQL
jgi:hypothetical protein